MLDQNTYLIIWNPSKWEWTDLQDKIEEVRTTGRAKEMWAFAAHKKVKANDRIFLMKLGDLPKSDKGIIASGKVIGESFVAPHWNGNGKMIYRVFVDFDTILDTQNQYFLSLDNLQNTVSNTFAWTQQSSGVKIPKEVANKLEESWFNTTFKKVKPAEDTLESKEDEDNKFREGNHQTLITRRYERNPYARKKCLEHYKYSCSVCEFSFEDYYGEIGKYFIHVHHLTPISDIGIEYQIDPIKDLRPVCPNCHAMLHKKQPPYTIEELKLLIKKYTNH